jgi:hypothetical protein
MSAYRRFSPFLVPLALGGLALGLRSTVAQAEHASVVEGLASDAVDYALPFRIICRAPSALALQADKGMLLVTVSPVPGKVVSSGAELKEGQCAGSRTQDNELSPKTYGAFGPKAIGPMRISLAHLQAQPRLTVRKDGRVSNLDAVSDSPGQPLPTSTEVTSFRSLLQWAQQGKGSIELSIQRDPREPRAGFLVALGGSVIARP